MNSIFSVEDFSDLLWQVPIPSPAMSRCPSDWELETFLQDFPLSAPAPASSSVISHSKPRIVDDDVVEIRKPEIPSVPLLNRLHLPSDRVPLADSDEYRAFLKAQLDIACAAAAEARESGVKPEANSSLAEDQRIAAKNFQSESQNTANGLSVPEISKSPIEVDGSTPAVPSMQKKQEVQMRQATSGSSREDSDDDELYGDTETNELAPPDEKRAKRMKSNRESARRSRSRKQAQLNELETQVGQLRDERTTLLTRLTDINKKCDDASVDHRILNANIETLRTKVKMAEDQVKRVTGLNPTLLASSDMGMQPNNNRYFQHPGHIQRINNNRVDNNLSLIAANSRADNGTTNIGADDV